MVNEAVCYETPIKFARYTVADGTGIAKGTILKLSSPNTATACGSVTDPVAGIAWMEKSANDGTTEIVAALDGTWGIYTLGSVTVGNQLSIAGSNTASVYKTLDIEKGYVLGRSLETATGSTVIKVRLNTY